MKPELTPQASKRPGIRKASLVAELSIEGVEKIHGVTYDGRCVWFADGTRGGLVAVDPESGKTVHRLPDIPADAGTAFDGKLLYQIADARIQKIDPKTGKIVGSIPLADDHYSGLTFAEGALWIGGYRERRIHKIDPTTGKVLKTIPSDRFVTGVSWVDHELWHGAWEDEKGASTELRRVDPESGEVLERLALPEGMGCAGVEGDDKGRLWFADQKGKLHAAKRPRG